MKTYDIPIEILNFEKRFENLQEREERLEDSLIAAKGEITPEIEAEQAGIEAERSSIQVEWAGFIALGKDKLEAAGLVLLRRKGDLEFCKAQIKRLEKRYISADRDTEQLKSLVLYALNAMGRKLKTMILTMWIQKSADQLAVELKPGTDLVELEKTHPQFVRATREPRLRDIKAVYEPLWEQVESKRSAELTATGENATDEEKAKVHDRAGEYWKELLAANGLPDCFQITKNPGTESLRIK